MRESDHLILIASGKIWAKATHSWLVSISGDNAANTAKVQGYALCLPTKRTGRPRTSPIMLLSCHEIAEARRLPPPPHLTSTHIVHLFHSYHHTQAHEKAAMRTAREPMRTAAERKDCPNGRACYISSESSILCILHSCQLWQNL